MEVLSDILRGLRTAGSVYFCDFLSPPWELAYDEEPRAIFHLVRRGRCSIQVDDEEHHLAPGDFVFLAPGMSHRVISDSDSDPDTLLLCGYCDFDADTDDILVKALPRFVLMT